MGRDALRVIDRAPGRRVAHLLVRSDSMPGRTVPLPEPCAPLRRRRGPVRVQRAALRRGSDAVPSSRAALRARTSARSGRRASLLTSSDAMAALREPLQERTDALLRSKDALPVRRATLRRGRDALPLRTASLPVRTASLPVRRASLLVRTASLPIRRASLPRGRESLAGAWSAKTTLECATLRLEVCHAVAIEAQSSSSTQSMPTRDEETPMTPASKVASVSADHAPVDVRASEPFVRNTAASPK